MQLKWRQSPSFHVRQIKHKGVISQTFLLLFPIHAPFLQGTKSMRCTALIQCFPNRLKTELQIPKPLKNVKAGVPTVPHLVCTDNTNLVCSYFIVYPGTISWRIEKVGPGTHETWVQVYELCMLCCRLGLYRVYPCHHIHLVVVSSGELNVIPLKFVQPVDFVAFLFW